MARVFGKDRERHLENKIGKRVVVLHGARLVEGLGPRLAQMSAALRTETSAIPDRALLRQLIMEKVGPICPIEDFPQEADIELIGVDGSAAGFGGESCRLDALAAVALSACGARVTKFDLVHSLDTESRASIEQMAAEKSLPFEAAQDMLAKCRLAALECQACRELLRHRQAGRKALALMDGGFLRYETMSRDDWCLLTDTAEETGTVLAGVIEEIGTFYVAGLVRSALDLEWPRNDRDLLFGLLDPGECILVCPDLRFKGDYYTVFARLSDHPQPVAVDFLRSQVDSSLRNVKTALRIILGTTPRASRGFPLWLDIVDAEARLTESDVEDLARHSLGDDVVEKLLMPQRKRREAF